MIHVGVNIYWWGEAEQRRLLRDGLRLWALQARHRGVAQNFWFCLFDARGPHVFALFSTSEEKQAHLQAFLAERIREFCDRFPSRAVISADELKQRHRECRGRFLCEADRISTLASNNSFEIFVHDPQGYPLWFGSGIADVAGFWRCMSALAIRNLRQVASGGLSTAAVRWIASIHRAVERLGFAAEPYWRLYASSLILPLSGSADADRDLAPILRGAIGERNRMLFDRLWGQPLAHSPEDSRARQLVRHILSVDRHPLEQRFRVLRELTHTVLGQLLQPANLRIPMVLYAWQRSLAQ